MKKVAVLTTLFSFLVFAQMGYSVSKDVLEAGLAASESAQASVSAQLKVEEVDLTVPSRERGKLEEILDETEVTGWWGRNILKIAIRNAVVQGVSPNTIVALFLFPLVATLVAFSRQVVGISGFGVIIPALLSVAFLSTGGTAGLMLLAFIMVAATLSRMLIRKVKIPYLPKLAMIVWMVSMLVLVFLASSYRLGLTRLIGVGIFPILLFILMAETYIEAQIVRSIKTALLMTAETVILALVAYQVMSAPAVQEAVLLHPELTAVGILLLDYLVGRYKGLRLMEVWRFRKLLSR